MAPHRRRRDALHPGPWRWQRDLWGVFQQPVKCHECGAFQAYRDNDDEKRRKVAEEWSKMYNADIKPEDINCSGCLSRDVPLFGHCRVCEIRNCALEKEVSSCAECPDYACEKLLEFFKMAPEAQTNLEGVRK